MKAVADIVIVNWNSADMLRDCVKSVLDHCEGIGRVVVVDNGSTDGSANLPEDVACSVDLLLTGQNLGFAKACNLGASRCTSPYVLFLNPDARLIEPSVARVVDFMESSEGKKYGICGIKLIGRNGNVERHCANFTDASTYIGQAFGFSGRFPKVFTPHFMRGFDHLSSRPVDQVIGAFFMVRRSLFDELRGFDERYFVYFEEVDFALRASKIGQPTYYISDTSAYHYGGGTSEKVKAHRLFYSLRSRLLYARRHFSPIGVFATFSVTLLIEPLSRVAQSLVKGSPGDAASVVRAYAMLIGNIFTDQES